MEKTEVINWWNNLAKMCKLSKIQVMTKDRWKKFLERKSEGLWDYKEAIEKSIIESDFLRGFNDREWKVHFDFIISNNGKWAKILEGYYSNERIRSALKQKDLEPLWVKQLDEL